MPTSLFKLRNTIPAIVAAALGAGLFGAEIGYWGQANSMKSFNRIMTGSMDQDVDNMDLDLVSLVLYISAVIFALPPVSGPILGKMGRRKILMIAGILFAVAFGFQGVAANVSYPASRGLMYTGRVILGIPVAFSVTNSPMFLTEIAPKEHRGFVGGMFQFTLMIFLVLGNGIGWAIKEFHPDCDDCVQYTAWWLVPFGLLVTGILYFSNDTPQFHLINGREQEAERILFHLREGADVKETRKEFDLMKIEIAAEKKTLGEFSQKSLFSGFPLRILLITCFNQFLNQWVGMNLLNNFAPRLFTPMLPGLGGMIGFVGVFIQMIGAFISAVATNRFGRRPLLMIGAAFLVLSWTTMAILGDTVITRPNECYKILTCPTGGNFTCDVHDDDVVFLSEQMAKESICGIDGADQSSCNLTVQDSDPFYLKCLYSGDNAPTASDPEQHFDVKYAWVFVAMSWLINFVYGATAGPIPWTYNSEISPNSIRAPILGYAAAVNLFFTGTMVFVPSILIKAIGFNAFWIFVAISAIAFGFWYWLVETNGLPLEVIISKWEDKLNCKYTNLRLTKNGTNLDTDSSNNDDQA